ncbi:MAG: hypothetical protein AAGI72_01560 [Pseudomonadota bacterium]
MKALTLAFLTLLPLATLAQSNRDVDDVRLPQCEDIADLREALSKVERMKGFSEDDDYKFLKGFGERCGRYKVRSRSNYRLHSYHVTDDFIFALYEVSGGKGYEGGKRVGFVANSVYSKDGWRTARGAECALAVQGGGCLIPKRCRAVNDKSDVSFYRKLSLDEFAAPPHCYGVGDEL